MANTPIQPVTPALSVNKTPQTSLKRSIDPLILSAIAVVVCVSLSAWWLTRLVQPPSAVTINPAAPATQAAQSATAANANPVAPFAQLSKAQAQTRVQDALAIFVETQPLLESTYDITPWGDAQLDAAKNAALAGDAEYLQENFAPALAAYQAANVQMQALVESAERRYQTALQAAVTGLNSYNLTEAKDALAEAMQVKPDAAALPNLTDRLQSLPAVINGLRNSRNALLQENYQEALDTLTKVQQLDPAMPGIAALVTEARQGQRQQRINELLSNGFAALAQTNWERARQSFQRVANLQPANNVAQAGLQQVSQRYEIGQIKTFQKQAESALSKEQWATAIQHFEAILAIDANIALAKDGVSQARRHGNAERTLTKIQGAPTKLSNARLYADAERILNDAQTLQFIGPKLTAALAAVSTLLEQYRDPVNVLFLSDNATEITLSNVGVLGVFSEKRLTLRPGQYTLRGSQVGCRDLYRSIQVLPGMPPVDVRCEERLQ